MVHWGYRVDADTLQSIVFLSHAVFASLATHCYGWVIQTQAGLLVTVDGVRLLSGTRPLALIPRFSLWLIIVLRLRLIHTL